MDARPIGVFDSGTGGVSLLRNLVSLMPQEDFIYYGDDKNAPYGTRPESEILELVREDVRFLTAFDVKAIVIACNTATSAAAEALRQELTLPVIGIEPALKPAEIERTHGEIAVLATPATLRQKKMEHLMQEYGSHAIKLPCAGLMEFAERGITEGAELDAFLEATFAPLKGRDISAAVLGCTHYVFLKNAISKALPNAKLYDGNEGTARQLKRVLEGKNLTAPDKKGSVRFYSSSNSKTQTDIMLSLMAMPL